jgi:serine O-acetyltransferase
LERIPELRQALSLDVQAAYDGDPSVRGLDEIIFCYPGLEAVTVYRIAHVLYELEVPLIPRMMTEWAHSKTGIDIHPGATIGSHFFIDHGTGVVIWQTCEIGHHVKLYQGVTLGALGFATGGDGNLVRHEAAPTIEDRVVIRQCGARQRRREAGPVIGSSVCSRARGAGSTVVLEKPKLPSRPSRKAETNYTI